MPGEFLYDGQVVAQIWGPPDAVDPAKVLRCLQTGVDRTYLQDPLFGFQLLVDIAMRAMSRINDPATVVQSCS